MNRSPAARKSKNALLNLNSKKKSLNFTFKKSIDFHVFWELVGPRDHLLPSAGRTRKQEPVFERWRQYLVCRRKSLHLRMIGRPREAAEQLTVVAKSYTGTDTSAIFPKNIQCENSGLFCLAAGDEKLVIGNPQGGGFTAIPGRRRRCDHYGGIAASRLANFSKQTTTFLGKTTDLLVPSPARWSRR